MQNELLQIIKELRASNHKRFNLGKGVEKESCKHNMELCDKALATLQTPQPQDMEGRIYRVAKAIHGIVEEEYGTFGKLDNISFNDCEIFAKAAIQAINEEK